MTTQLSPDSPHSVGPDTNGSAPGEPAAGEPAPPRSEHGGTAGRPGVGGLAVRAALVVAVVAAGLVVARSAVAWFQPHLYTGTVLQAPSPAPSMAGLTLASGEPLDLAAFDGEVVLVFFGYTNCPDICPGTLATATLARASLPTDLQDEVNVLMVSVDPARDSVDDVQRYVGSFDESFLAAGGSAADIDRVAAQYGVYHVRSDAGVGNDDAAIGSDGSAGGADDAAYLIDHTASLLGIGPDGHLRVVWAPDVDADRLAADLRELVS